MRTSVFYVLASIFIFISCEKQKEDIPVFKYQDDKKAADLITAGSEFGLDLFKWILESDDCPDNMMISPMSVAIALGMTYNGAEGDTKTAFENTLRHQGLSREEINDIYKALIDYLLKADPKVIFEIANSIWYRQGFDVLPSFIDINKNYYYAEVSDLDFSNANAVQIINDWAAVKTHDKIKDVLDNIPPDAVMYLINALYFNGMWKYQFDEKNSFTGNFYGENDVYQAQYMKNESTYRYLENDLLQAVELPYGNGNFVMHVFIHKASKSLDDIVQSITPENWKAWMESFAERNEVIVQLPKFKYEYKTLLNDPLIDMGLGLAFNGPADFSGISPGHDLYISRVIHQTFIDVNEKGTEAAAVTVVEIRETSYQPKTSFIVDKPFIYAISEKNTGSLLFMGKVGNPSL